jgi:hypothetical protein
MWAEWVSLAECDILSMDRVWVRSPFWGKSDRIVVLLTQISMPETVRCLECYQNLSLFLPVLDIRLGLRQ